MNRQNGITNGKRKVVSTYVVDNNWSARDGELDHLAPQSTVYKNGFLHSRGRPMRLGY